MDILFLLGIGFLFTIVIAIFIAMWKEKMIKIGRKLIEENSQNTEEINKVISFLGIWNDAESIEIVRRLYNLKEKG